MTDKYVETSWDEAFAGIAAELKALDPKSVIFYASGRASLETSYLYALFARLYGHNNLPDSSNMCHETTSVELKKVTGSPVGTCVLDDFEKCDAIFFFGQNTGQNSPRFLHPLQDAVRRGCRIVTFNPIREKGLIAFTNPQEPAAMLTGKETCISELYLQVRPSGDIAAMMGLCKHVMARERRHWTEEHRHLLDVDFIEQHCHGFDGFVAHIDATDWDEIERESGIARADLEKAADIYCDARKVIGIYGMGVTQHVHGSQTIGMFVNLLAMRGNLGREGAGISPVRGHSNVQGQRTVGISEKPELVPYDKLRELFGFDPPPEKGMATVEACKGMIDGSVQAFIGLGGNFVRAIPERGKMEEAWRKMRLTVQIATKLNRSHLINGKSAWLLPCLGRSEEDMQESGPQTVTMEDSLSMIHGSRGHRKPASDHLLSELAIVAGIAKATLPPKPGRYRLVTLRSNDQFNTTIYGFSDRMRGIEGRRDLLLISPDEMARAGLAEGQVVALETDAEDGVHREVAGLRVTPFDLPVGCVGAYYPEANPLVPLDHHDCLSKTPAYKSVPVRIRP